MQNLKGKQWAKPVCVQSSVNVNPASSFNEWAQSLRDEDAEFERAWQGFKRSLIKARTK
jgi:hypothetical protein